MGSMNGTVRNMRDYFIEEVALRARLLLTDSDVRSVLTADQVDRWAFEADLDQLGLARFHSTELDACFISILAGVGFLADAEPAEAKMARFFMKHRDSEGQVRKVTEAFRKLLRKEREYPGIGSKEDIDFLQEESGAPRPLVFEYLHMMAEYQTRKPEYILHDVDMQAWDGVTPLAKLFDMEALPQREEEFIDQKFIDYLAANERRLVEIHWRNFERLCAQFFDNAGYHVELGPGRNDGGIDLRIWPTVPKDRQPPLLLVQCKRYKDGNLVDIEYVKAFYTDVHFENAKGGLIATTSQVAPGGKTVSAVRNWPLSFLEREQITELLQANWRHAPTGFPVR